MTAAKKGPSGLSEADLKKLLLKLRTRFVAHPNCHRNRVANRRAISVSANAGSFRHQDVKLGQNSRVCSKPRRCHFLRLPIRARFH